MATSSTQHGSGLADSSQPSTRQRQHAGSAPTHLEGIRAEGSLDGSHTGKPCATGRVETLGHEARQRRQPVYFEGQKDMDKPRGPVSTDNVLRLLEYQQYRCALTGRELMPETAALDHIIPIRCDGEHVIENTQVLHKEINRAKGSLTNEQFSRLCREVADHMAFINTQGADHED
ncbi:MAG TPA: hypothetical protein VFW73_01105 [Lacipirellulaceae bacterium]|nr:hypothetical protein [Lacipirellulaceae bacterium]